MTFPKGLAEEAGSAGKPLACLSAGTHVGASVEVLRREDDRTGASRLARPRKSAAGSGGNTPELRRKETIARRSGGPSVKVAPYNVGEGVPSLSRVNVGLGERKGSREACRDVRSEAASRGVTPGPGVLCVAAMNR